MIFVHRYLFNDIHERDGAARSVRAIKLVMQYKYHQMPK